MPTRTNAARDTNPSGTGAPPRAQSNSYRDSTLGIFALLLAFRIVNALTLRTFFQPDEFFQSLEPAWQLAFGPATHAWITWSLAVFYGRNRGDYYFTEGLPLLLTTSLPFAVIGLWQSLQGPEPEPFGSAKSDRPDNTTASSQDATGGRILARLSWTVTAMTVTLSLISHKEVHQRGVIDVLAYLRHKHETRNSLLNTRSSTGSNSPAVSNTTVGFLMPCHSTPWRSHLVYPEISAWALTCEPPINIPLSERSTYLDEADEFYIKPGPVAWLRGNMEDVQTIKASGSRSGQHWTRQDPKFKRKYRRQWPQNLVFFEQLEATLEEYLEGTRYQECWRGFNSHFHDDSRRTGDVVVWCLDGV
ncbi:unnamed protein product [Alternaria alternata]